MTCFDRLDSFLSLKCIGMMMKTGHGNSKSMVPNPLISNCSQASAMP